ncbi:MAG: hypothetical protein ACI80V_002178 [Rhodothermales bacterium]|jgi:hypothetical protein
MTKNSILLLLLFGGILGCDGAPAEEVPYEEDLGLAQMDWHKLKYQDPFLYVLGDKDGLWRADVEESAVEWEFLGQTNSSGTTHGQRSRLRTVIHNESDHSNLIASRDLECCESVPVIHETTDRGELWTAVEGLSFLDSGFLNHHGASDFFLVDGAIVGMGPTAVLRGNFLEGFAIFPEAYNTVFARSPAATDQFWSGGTKFFNHGQAALPLGYSVDGGHSWVRPTNPPPNPEELLGVSSIGLGSDPSRVYLGIHGLREVQSLFTSADLGESWTSLQPGSSRCCRLVAASSVTRGLVWASEGDTLYTSHDSGESWDVTEVDGQLLDEIIDLEPSSTRDEIFVLTTTGVYRHRENRP